MGVLNLPQLGADAGDKNPGAAAVIVSPLLQLLMKNISEKKAMQLESAQTEKTATSLEDILNSGVSRTTPIQPEEWNSSTGEIKPPVNGGINPEFTVLPRDNKILDEVGKELFSTKGYSAGMAHKAYSGLMTNGEVKGYQRAGLEKILAEGDPNVFKEYKKNVDEMALGVSKPEYQRIRSIPSQAENAAYLKDYMLQMEPTLGDASSTETVTMSPNKTGVLVENPNGAPYRVQKDKLGDTIGKPSPTQQNYAGVMGDLRTSPGYDTSQGNVPTFVTPNMIKKEPGRYMPTSGGTKALNQEALLEDIRGAISNTRTSLSKMPDFTAGQAAQLALVMKSRDPHSAISTFMGSEWGKTLTTEQIDYITDLAQLQENAMAMRGVLGAGQGSDELRAAIKATIPSAGTPSREYAVKQLDKFESQLNRLGRGVPKVTLKPENVSTPPLPGGMVFQTGSGNKFTIVPR